MRVEELTRLVLIQRRGDIKDETGAVAEGWANVVTAGNGKVWARVKDQTGRQYMAARAEQNAVMTEIAIRKRAGIEARMRVLYGARIYDVEAVLDTDPTWTILMCISGVSNG
ncbi:phage head closure protein [Massilia sp. DWR3-1-1]|uniref:phage head closure protein n=1 Tax=Massilia sp. DWR3-1-1 TaxID=2804559 RepID=UPI003CF4E282